MFPVPLTAPAHSFQQTPSFATPLQTIRGADLCSLQRISGRRVNSEYWDDGYANPVYDYSSDSTSGSTPRIRRTRHFRSSGSKIRPRSLSTSSDVEEIQTYSKSTFSSCVRCSSSRGFDPAGISTKTEKPCQETFEFNNTWGSRHRNRHATKASDAKVAAKQCQALSSFTTINLSRQLYQYSHSAKKT